MERGEAAEGAGDSVIESANRTGVISTRPALTTRTLEVQMAKDKIDSNLKTTIEELIGTHGPPDVLRAIGLVCQETYEAMSRRNYDKYISQDVKRGFFNEAPFDERYDRDIASAWLCVDTEYIASSFESRIQHAGESNAEHDKRIRSEELQKAESRVKELKREA